MNFNKNKNSIRNFDINFNRKNILLKLKPLIFHKKKVLGRNNGKIIMRYKGGGCKRNYRLLIKNKTFYYNIAIVRSIQYDPNRSSRIALIQYLNGSFSYILASKNLSIKDYIYFYDEKYYNLLTFNSIIPNLQGIINVTLNDVPKGVAIFNIEQYPKSGAVYCKAGGTAGYIIKKNNYYALIRLSSKKKRLFLLECKCIIGVASNIYNKYHKKYKAGTNRWLNRRPHVRGVAKNPVDHPHGGGEGKTSGGRPSVSPWGKITKGLPTSRTKKKLNLFIKKKIQ